MALNRHDFIDILKVELEKMWNELIVANDEFKRAVQRKTNRCGFAEVIQCVGAIAAIATSGGALLGALSAAKVAFDTANPLDANGQPITGDFAKEAEHALIEHVPRANLLLNHLFAGVGGQHSGTPIGLIAQL